MAKILFNPEDGAEIKNFVFNNEHFMDAKEGQAFMPGMVIRVDDELANYMLEQWGFLRELTVEEAKEYLDAKDDLKCEKCDFKTKVKIGFESHKRKHMRESAIDELGIPTVTRKEPIEKIPLVIENLRQKGWEDEDKKAGLTGPGMTDDIV